MDFTLYSYPQGTTYTNVDTVVTVDYISAQQNSSPNFQAEYGYLEVCAQMAPGQGPWNAGWAITERLAGKGEIDLVEQYGGTDATEKSTYYSTIHWTADGTHIEQLPSNNQITVTGTDLTAGFHMYGVQWTPSSITFYLDGVPKGSPIDISGLVGPDGTNPFAHPMPIIISLVCQLGSGAINASTVLPATMYTKYFRFYRTSDTTAISGNATSTLTYAPPATGTSTITGTVNYNIAGTPPVAGTWVELCDANKTAIANVQTNSSGVFSFGSIAAGTYNLHYLYPVAWVPPTSGGPTDKYGYTSSTITVASGQTATATTLSLVAEPTMNQGQPVFAPGSTTEPAAFNVTLTSPIPSATIYYTTDGSTPTTTISASVASVASGGSITISKSETVKALATATNYALSPVSSATYTISGDLPVGDATGGDANTLVVKSDGTVWLWGAYGTSSPTQVSGLSNIVAVSSAHGNQFALTSQGTVYAWGSNGNGQLGNGGTSSVTSPALIANLTGVTRIVAGEYFTLAVKSDGTMYAWGSNSNGALGVGTPAYEYTPTQVQTSSGNLTNVVSAGAGSYAAYAVTSSGALYAWGRDAEGELGDGATTQQNYAKLILSSGVRQVAGGAYHAIFLKTDGTVWGMGDNNYGQLGLGTVVSPQKSPVQAIDLPSIFSIDCSPGGSHNVALDNSGYIWTWGYNNDGQLGNGTTSSYNATPAKVLASADVDFAGATIVAAGQYHSIASGPGNKVWAWGDNNAGQLGNGTTTNSSYPVESGTLTLARVESWLHGLLAELLHPSDPAAHPVAPESRG